MSTSQEVAGRFLAQLTMAAPVEIKAMFGEYSIYLDGKVIGFICDDQVLIKKTPSSEAELSEEHDAAPYPGAKLCHKISEAMLKNTEWLAGFLKRAAEELPAPKPKKPKR